MAKPIIDVSQFNGTINWETVKPQIDGAIIRCGYGGNIAVQDDTQYLRNVQECTRLKIPFGVYLFSYARSVAEAKDEAEHVLRLVKGWNLALPIYYDLERSSYVGDLSAALYAQIATAFCEQIEAVGGYVGIYANLDYWTNKLMNVNAYTRWLAQWSSAPTFDKKFMLWQYTSDGKINGSSERTDLNRYYDNFLTMAGKQNYFGSIEPDPKPEPPDNQLKYKVGEEVSFRALYRSSDAIVPITDIAVHKGKITKIIAKARNPYLINDGTGWVNDAVITTNLPVQTYKVGDQVRFHALYVSSDAQVPVTDIAVHQGTITKTVANARNPYLINNGTGWVNDRVIDGYVSSALLQLHDRVRVKANAKDYQGNPLAPFVYQTTYDVMEIKGDRVVIGKDNQVTAAVAANNLIKV